MEEQAPPVERNEVPQVKYEPFEDIISHFGQYFARDRAVGQQQFDAGSLQALWMKWQEQAAMQQQGQDVTNAKEDMIKKLREYGQTQPQAQQQQQLPQPAMGGVRL